jgi:hypothetical protein
VVVTIGVRGLKVVVPEQLAVEEVDVVVIGVIIEPDAFVDVVEVVEFALSYGAPANSHISIQTLPNRG